MAILNLHSPSLDTMIKIIHFTSNSRMYLPVHIIMHSYDDT